MPNAPDVGSNRFGRWTLDGNTIATEAAIKAELVNSKKVILTPIFVYQLNVTASKFSVSYNNEIIEYTDHYEKTFSKTEWPTITVEFVGDNDEIFLYWVDENGKILSSNAEYSFTLVTDTSLRAVTGKNDIEKALVVFLSDAPDNNPQVISQRYYTNTEAINFPTAPSKLGYVYKSWSLTEDQIHSGMADASRIEVYPLYEEGTETYHIMLNYMMYGQTTPYKTYDIGEFKIGKGRAVTSGNKANGKYFSYFTDENGTILGYSRSITVRPTRDVVLNAVFGAPNVIGRPVTVVTNAYASTNSNGEHVLNFTISRTAPDTYTLVHAGVLYAKAAALGTDPEDLRQNLVLENTTGTISVSRFTNTTLNEAPNFYITVSNDDTPYIVRGYIIAKDADSNLSVFYSDNALYASYNSVGNYYTIDDL